MQWGGTGAGKGVFFWKAKKHSGTLYNLFLYTCNYGAKQAPHSTEEQPPLATSKCSNPAPAWNKLAGPSPGMVTTPDLTPMGHRDVILSSNVAPKAHTSTEVWCTKHLQI